MAGNVRTGRSDVAVESIKRSDDEKGNVRYRVSFVGDARELDRIDNIPDTLQGVFDMIDISQYNIDSEAVINHFFYPRRTSEYDLYKPGQPKRVVNYYPVSEIQVAGGIELVELPPTEYYMNNTTVAIPLAQHPNFIVKIDLWMPNDFVLNPLGEPPLSGLNTLLIQKQYDELSADEKGNYSLLTGVHFVGKIPDGGDLSDIFSIGDPSMDYSGRNFTKAKLGINSFDRPIEQFTRTTYQRNGRKPGDVSKREIPPSWFIRALSGSGIVPDEDNTLKMMETVNPYAEGVWSLTEVWICDPSGGIDLDIYTES